MTLDKSQEIETATSPATPAEHWDDRTRQLLGDERLQRLAAARVAVVGLGGVGGYAAEMLARSGVGRLTLIDADTVAPSNINRQLIALQSEIGTPKTELFAARFRNINPDIEIDARREFLTPESAASLVAEGYDYIIDAIDTVAPKVALIREAMIAKSPIISSMGAGGRIDPTRIKYADLWETREDGLARAVRARLKKQGLRRSLRVVYSDETPASHSLLTVETQNKLTSYGTLASVPAIFGIYLANHVILKIAGV